MKSRTLFLLVALSVLSASAQVGPPVSSVERGAVSIQQSIVKPGSAPTEIDVVADVSAAGGDEIELVLSDPGINVSLTLPGGIVVDASTAASVGIIWTVNSLTLDDVESIAGPFSFAGTHISVELPAGALPGVYKILADGSSLAVQAGLLAQYVSSSAVRFGGVTDSIQYRLGEPVTIAAFLSDGQTPLTNATVFGQVYYAFPVPGTISLQLQNKQDQGDGSSLYAFLPQFTNSGGAQIGVLGAASSSDSSITISDGEAYFGDVSSSQTATGQNVIRVIAPSDYQDLANALTWTITAASTQVAVTLSDAGAPDATPGDGVYTAQLVPPAPGDYTIFYTASGTSASGTQFQRTAVSSFTVTAPLAHITSVTSAVQLDSQSGQLESLNVVAQLDVQQPGTYQLSGQLLASNGNVQSTTIRTTLDSGSQTVNLRFSSSALLALGVDGAPEMKNVILTFVSSSSQELADIKIDAGSTVSYQRSSIDPGPVYFSGSGGSSVVTNTAGSYDQLTIQFAAYTPGGECAWQGALTDIAGHIIDVSYATGLLNAQLNNLVFSFSGPKIAQAAFDGPYQVRNVTLSCGSYSTQVSTLYQTGQLSASQFTTVPATFSLALSPGALSGVPSSTVSFGIRVNGSVTFTDAVEIFLQGLPAGVAVQSGTLAVMPNAGPVSVSLNIGPNVAIGTYPIAIQGVSRNKTASGAFMLTVSSAPVTTSVSPGIVQLAASERQQFTALIKNTKDQDVTWTMSPAIGSLSGDGLYTAPQMITSAMASASPVLVTATSTIDASQSSQAGVYLYQSQEGPSGWITGDVGYPNSAGHTSYSNGQFSLTGSGTIGDPGDVFQYAFTHLGGDGSIVARLSSLGGTSKSIAGLMIRDTLEPTASNVFLNVQDATTLYLDHRSIATGETVSSTGFAFAAPRWLKLVKLGGTITAFTSPDGNAWTQVGSVALQMGQSVYAGLVVDSNGASSQATVTFDNVSVSGVAAPFNLSTPASTVVSPSDAAIRINIVQIVSNGFQEQVAYSVSGLPTGMTGNFTVNALTGSGTIGLTLTLARSTAPGCYPITITGSSSSATQSVQLNLIVEPAQGALPSGWSNRDIGSTGLPGQAAFGGGIFHLSGAGNGLSETYSPESFQFAYTTLAGDGSFTARLLEGSQAGITFRDSLNTGSAYVFLSVVEGFCSRSLTGGIDQYNYVVEDRREPQWLRLVRTGGRVSAFTSLDGVVWTQIGNPIAVGLSTNIYAGFAVSSGHQDTLEDATFDNVTQVTAVTITPITVSLSASQTQQFTATVANSGNTAVTWMISPNVGSVSTAGLYTAPSSISSQQTVTVTATSAADSTKSTAATISLVPPAGSSSGVLQTDQFDASVVNTSVWSFYSSLGDGSLAEGSSHLQIVTGTGNSHYPNTSGNTAAQALQQVANSDFQVEAKFDSTPSESSEGIMALQDESNYVHCSIASNDDGIHPFSAFLSGSTASNDNYASIGSSASYWLRLARAGNNWTCSVSTDGVSYSTVTNFSQALTLNKLGVWAGNWAGTAFTAQVDYFSNGFTTTASPGLQTDQFDASGVNASVWSFFSSLADGSLGEGSGHLQIVTGTGNSHYPNTSGNTATQVLQQVANSDFQVEAKFDSTPSESSEGIMALQDESNYVHCSIASNDDGIHPFSAFFSGSTASNDNYASIGSSASYWLRLARAGNNWTCSVSTDGVSYSTVTNFSQALTLNKLGVWAGNWAGTAFAAQVDYFSNGFTQ